ncbi:MAG: dihydroorotase, partial [bacterium]
MDLLLKGGKVIDPSREFEEIADILIKDGIIQAIEKEIEANVPTIDAGGKFIFPAFVDLHCHLREPGQEHKEDLLSGSKAGVAGGFCALCAMPNTSPPLHSKSQIAYLQKKGENLPLYIFPIGALTQEMKGEALAPIA